MKNIEFGIGYTYDYSKSAPVKFSYFDTQIGHFQKVISVFLHGEWISDELTCNMYNH